MAITDEEKEAFNELERTFENKRAALAECYDLKTKARVVVVCHLRFDGEYVFTPLAKLFSGDPTKEVSAPGDEIAN